MLVLGGHVLSSLSECENEEPVWFKHSLIRHIFRCESFSTNPFDLHQPSLEGINSLCLSSAFNPHRRVYNSSCLSSAINPYRKVSYWPPLSSYMLLTFPFIILLTFPFIIHATDLPFHHTYYWPSLSFIIHAFLTSPYTIHATHLLYRHTCYWPSVSS